MALLPVYVKTGDKKQDGTHYLDGDLGISKLLPTQNEVIQQAQDESEAGLQIQIIGLVHYDVQDALT